MIVVAVAVVAYEVVARIVMSELEYYSNRTDIPYGSVAEIGVVASAGQTLEVAYPFVAGNASAVTVKT